MTESIPADVQLPPRAAWVGITLEALVAFGAAALFLVSCLIIRVYPLDRLGQISALASLALRFFVFGIALVLALVLVARYRPARFEATSRLVCAAVAGLVTAFIAGGILVALRGTPWGLNGMGGDVGILAQRAAGLHRGEPLPPLYPPLALHVLHYYSDLMDLSTGHAIKHLQILGTAAFGPVAYLSWRLLLRAPWALAIGVISVLPLVEPYKPFSNLVLVVFVPLCLLFLQHLRDIAVRSSLEITRAAIAFGIAFGVLCLTYSGWFQWAAPGLFVATLVLFPWKLAPRKATLFMAITGAAFALISGRYLAGLFDPAAAVVDNYVYFDVKAEPMYIAMWRGDAPGIVGVWPPIGELGGVGLFTIVLVIGLGGAIALGRKTPVLIGTVAMLAGAWLLRFYYARTMWDTKLVQLYPRTTIIITYCLLVLAGYAVYWWVQRRPADSAVRSRASLIGAVTALLLLFASAASSTTDRYMPLNTD
ncbi:MAG: hypothetical protein M3619_28355, partial [Myxococcota bacterium]|nr:hypothetical protein [Myxococcota bacterium]